LKPVIQERSKPQQGSRARLGIVIYGSVPAFLVGSPPSLPFTARELSFEFRRLRPSGIKLSMGLPLAPLSARHAELGGRLAGALQRTVAFWLTSEELKLALGATFSDLGMWPLPLANPVSGRVPTRLENAKSSPELRPQTSKTGWLAVTSGRTVDRVRPNY